tara:strand:+ start:143 stop:1720 length:1578 start_codon:yes stop_codon:yes gene_type:complete
MTSKLVVNTIEADTGISSVSFASSISMSSTSKFHFSNAGIDIGADTNINRPATGVLGFNINGSEKVRINSSGRLGLGTNNPDTSLTVQSGGDAQMSLKNSSGTTKAYVGTAGVFGSAGTDDLRIRSDSSNIVFGFSGSEKLRMISTGKVGIATTSPDARLHVLSGNEAGILIEDNSISNNAPYLEIIAKRDDGNVHQNFSGQVFLSKNRTTQKISSGEKLGTILFGGNHTNASKSNILYAASMAGMASDDFDSASDMPTDLVFFTGSTGRAPTTANVSSGEERLRITSNGRINIGDTDQTQNVDQFSVSLAAQNAVDNVARFQSTAAASGTSESLVKIYKGAGYGGVISGYITQGSDHGLKFYTANNGNLSERLRINSDGYVTKPSNPKFWAKSNNAQTLYTNGTNVIKNYQNEIYDIGNCYDGTNKFTAPIDGYYHFGWSFMIQGGNTDNFNYLFGAPLISGNDIAQEVMTPRSGGAQYVSVVGSHLLYLTSGQYVQIRMRQSGGSGSVSVRSDQAYFWGYLVG